jgi:hypothetical protein
MGPGSGASSDARRAQPEPEGRKMFTDCSPGRVDSVMEGG